MPAQPLVLDPPRLHLLALSADSARSTLHLRTCSDTAPCPQCGRLSARVHSRYCRTLSHTGGPPMGRHTGPHAAVVPPLLL